jgi:hypothetical protein
MRLFPRQITLRMLLFVVAFRDAFDSRSTPVAAVTDSGGRAQLTDLFEATGQTIAWRTIGEFSPWGRWLEISAPE